MPERNSKGYLPILFINRSLQKPNPCFPGVWISHVRKRRQLDMDNTEKTQQ